VTTPRSPLRSLLTAPALIRIALTVAAIAAIVVGLTAWIGDRTSLHVAWLPTRPIDLLRPAALYLVAVVPLLYLLRVLSLTDLSLAQQLTQATLRALVLAGLAVALARPAWTTSRAVVATVALIDVSDSVSDKQLAAARSYVDALDAAVGDGSLQVVTFAEKPRVVARPDGKPRSSAIARHAGHGAGTDAQAAMQLAYGLYPDGTLPRLVIVSDGNQTQGDVAVEAYRAVELGVRVSWRTFDQDKTSELRVVGVSVPDDLKVGQPYDVTAEVWSTEPQKVTLALTQDGFPNGLEPQKELALREGKNLIKFKSEAKHAGATTYKLAVARFEHDTEPQNNVAVMTAPVKGRPNVLYVEGGILREPGQAGHLQRALEHENIDVTVRGPAGIPSTAKELEPFDLVLVSDVPARLLGAGQMAALDAYVGQLGGGLIMAGGEDSFGSGGYERTKIEQIMPVRFDSEKIKEQPDVAVALVIDRSGSMQGPKLEAAKESARATAEVLSPGDYIAVVAFDSRPAAAPTSSPASSRRSTSSRASTPRSSTSS
jgi:Ca-activated chloride channel homolog